MYACTRGAAKEHTKETARGVLRCWGGEVTILLEQYLTVCLNRGVLGGGVGGGGKLRIFTFMRWSQLE